MKSSTVRPAQVAGSWRMARPAAGRVLRAISLASLWLAALGCRAEVGLALAPSPSNLPIYVADARGLFAAEGVTVRLIHCEVGRLCLRMLLDGQTPLCTVADLPIALAAFRGVPFSVVATINTDRNDTKIVTRRSGDIRRLTDLEGRRVGTHVGTTAQYVLDSLLLLDGADPARVTVVNVAPGDAAARFAAHEVDAMATFEPYASDLARSLGSDALVFDSQRIYTQTVNLVEGGGSRAPSAADLQGVLRALDRAAALIRRDPEAAKALLRERLKLDPQVIARNWPALNYDIGLNQALITTLEGEARWAQRLGTVTGPMPNYLDFVQTEPLRRVRPDSVTLVK